MTPELMMGNTKAMIDDLKAVLQSFGLGNSPGAYKIISQLFLYKFLNDKFFFEIRQADETYKDSKNIEADLAKLSEDEYEFLVASISETAAQLKREHFISYLFNNKNKEGFHTLFDDTLVDISNLNIEVFSVKTGAMDTIKLFEPISNLVPESNRRDDFCRAMIDKLVSFSFEGAFEQKYDFFAAVFEYLIKDFNKDFGSYAEYYTPHNIATIIARVLAPEGATNATIYDPAAGTGTLVLALAHQIGEDNCTIYTQDISQKSNEFMRLNLILNGLIHSLSNVIHGDTLVSPQHLNHNKNGLRKFDYIVSNPPFNVDFSDTRDTLAGDNYKERFFAGVPKIPEQNKNGMAIYQMFLQHIIFSLKEDGKAAIVVPTGFLTASSGIPKAIKEYIVEHRMLRGVISMPSNIFATTGTNVSILFIDGSNKEGKVILMDASKLGRKEKVDGKNQKTVLDTEDIDRIINVFNKAQEEHDFSVVVDYADIEKKKYSFSAGQYFKVEIKVDELTPDEFAEKMESFSTELNALFAEGRELEEQIKKQLGRVKYE